MITQGDEVKTRERYPVPCGRYITDDARKAIEHAARCPGCSAASRAEDSAGDGPRPGSGPLRRQRAGMVVDVVEQYVRSVHDGHPEGRQVTRLAQCIALLEVTLEAETNGRAGDANSHAHKVLGRYQTASDTLP